MLLHARMPSTGVARVPARRGVVVTQACGALGPGSGKRRSPHEIPSQQFDSQDSHRSTFAQKSTEECYKEFPFLVRVAMPLSITDREPAGLSAQQVKDAGPATGRRRRPAAVDTEGVQSPPALPHPAAPKDLKRERLLRTHILLA